MNLKYHILWFDDSEEWFGSVDLEPLKATIRSWGFEPEITPVFTADAFAKHAPYAEFDLIVVDFNLESYGEGSKFIGEIRGHGVYTEIVFYSAKASSDLWKAIHEHKIEGVFVSDRPTITTKVQNVAQQSVKKVLDVENMRGIVMAEVGSIDHLLDAVVKLAVATLPGEQQEKFLADFHDSALEHAEKRCAELAEFIKSPDVETMLSLCDSGKRWYCIKRLKKGNGPLKGLDVGDYLTEILMPRNFLAHGVPRKDGAGGYVFSYQGKEYKFNEQVGNDLRTKIMAYRDKFQKIHDVMQKK